MVEEKKETQFKKPFCGLIGTDGNTFSLTGRIRERFKSLGLEQDSSALSHVIFNYSKRDQGAGCVDTLFLMSNVVDIGEYREELYYLEDVEAEEELLQAGYTEGHLYAMKNKNYTYDDPDESLELYSYDINKENVYGRTPLFYAKNEKICSEFKSFDVDWKKEDMWGLTPLEFNNVIEVQNLMIDYLINNELFESWANGNNIFDNRLCYYENSNNGDYSYLIESLVECFKNQEKSMVFNEAATAALSRIAGAESNKIIKKYGQSEDLLKEKLFETLPAFCCFFSIDPEVCVKSNRKDLSSEFQKRMSEEFSYVIKNQVDLKKITKIKNKAL